MKTLLRKADARTIDETWRTIGALLDCFTPKHMLQVTSKMHRPTKLRLQPMTELRWTQHFWNTR